MLTEKKTIKNDGLHTKTLINVDNQGEAIVTYLGIIESSRRVTMRGRKF